MNKINNTHTVSIELNIKCDHRTARKEIKQKYAQEFTILRSKLSGLARFTSILNKYVEQIDLEKKLKNSYPIFDFYIKENSENNYQNLLVTNAQILITTLLTAINNSISQVPSSSENFAPIINDINKINNKIPNITEQDLQDLYQLSIAPKPILDNKFSSSQQLLFWQDISIGYNQINKNISNSQMTLKKELNQTDQEIIALQLSLSISNNMFSISETFCSNIVSDNISDAIYSSHQIAQEYLNILEEIPFLNANQQELINTALENWLNLPVGLNQNTFSGTLMADFCGSTLAVTQTSLFLSKNGPSTSLEIKNFLTNTLNEQLQSNPINQPIINFINQLCNNQTVFNSLFLQENGNYASINPNYEQTFLKNSSINPNYDNLILSVDFQLEKDSQIFLTELQNQRTILQKEYELIAAENTSFSEEFREIRSNINHILSLGKAFTDIVLNVYLPNQQKMLQPYINTINYNNIGATTINNLLSITSSFNTASIYYNFSSFLVESDQGPDLFSGSYSQLTLVLNQEKQQLQQDLIKLDNLTNTVNDSIADINGNNSLNDTQKKNIVDKLNNYLKMFSTSKNQLLSLKSLLDQINITLVNNNNNYVKITGPTDWQKNLGKLEQDVVNGSSSTTPSGGLVPIFTQTESDQQSYTNQGQTQQLNLQTQMTTIQQEWTIIATSLQILNQTISLLANSIYK